MPQKKVLIVDDDPTFRRIAQTAIVKAGFEVLIAADAMGALMQAKNQKPDLIILDLGLPAGGGFTFLERMQQLPATSVIPVVIVSGKDRATNEPRALAAGVAGYFEKPVTPEEIVAKVTEILA
jgi:DNA-binding response OmpR family regulator